MDVMDNLRLLLICVILSFIHCTVPQKTPPAVIPATGQQTIEEKIESGTIQFNGGNGLTKDSAIVIVGPVNDKEAISAEYIYISKKYGERYIDWKLQGQALLVDQGKSYDLMQIKDFKNNSKVSLYFDITASTHKH